MDLFKGVGTALITPFKKDGNIDYETLEKLINYQIENKVDAIIIAGTTGEASTLTHEEHMNLIKECVKYVDKRIPVIAGTGSNNTKTAINNSKEAEQLGADGLLIVTPYYNKTTQNGLINHYKKISEQVNIPIILYNVPSRTGLNIEPNTVKELVEQTNNIKGIKEASGNINNIIEIKNLLGDKINIYSGNDDQIVPILSLGGVGVISVISNILPKETHELIENYLKGDIEKSRKEQIKMLKLIKALFIETNPIPIKKAMEEMKLINGTLREPLVELEEEHKKILKREMRRYGIDI